MQRMRQLAVDDEEELLRMQEQFAAGDGQGDNRPAAKFTRISRRPAASEGAAPVGGAAASTASGSTQHQAHQGCAVHGAGCQGHHHHHHHHQQQQDAAGATTAEQPQMAGLLAAMQEAMKGIVGEVQERPTVAAAPTPPQAAVAAQSAGPTAPDAGTSTGAFPQATHRKLSKFALGRQRQRAATATPSPAAIAVPPPLQAAAAPGAAAGAPADEGSMIDAENRQLLAAMSPEQLEEARKEALQRLPPSAVEFLRRRGAEKAAAAATPAATPAATAAAVEQPLPPEGPGSANHAAGDTRRAQQRPGRQHQHPQQQPAPGASQGSVVARLRFDVDGSVVGLRPAGSGAEVAAAEVAERDPIRQDEGIAGEGYSIQEACLLSRSSLAQQRVLALRLLAAVLALSRPSVAGSSSRHVPLPPEVTSQLTKERQGDAQQAAVEWVAVWHYALHTAEVTLLLRRCLDDSHAAVCSAAAEALAALLGAAGPAAAAEEAAAEAADACPLIGWPAPPLRHMQRPTAGGAWVAVPARPGPGHVGSGGEEEADEEDEEEPLDERQLAKVDPLSGLVHMSLLDRVAYLLGTARVAAAVDSLLSILIRCCQAGKDVADRVAETPGLIPALKVVLDAPPPPLAPVAGAGAGVGAGGVAQDALGAAFYVARPKTLRLLRQLAAASKAAARLLQETGLVRFPLEQLLRPVPHLEAPSSSTAAPPTLAAAASQSGADAGVSSISSSDLSRRKQERGMLTEALRLCRCFAMHRFYLLLLDDAYPCLCAYLAPPAATVLAALAAEGGGQEQAAMVAGSAAAVDELQQWCTAREVYGTVAQLCWHAASCDRHDSMLSPQCAAALAAEAPKWAAALPLHQLLQACFSALPSSTGTSSSGGDGDGRRGAAATLPDESGALVAKARLSPYPALSAAGSPTSGSGSGNGSGNVDQQPAAVVLGTLAAVLHFISSYWSVQVWHTGAEKAAAAQQLAGLGLLPPADSNTSTGGNAGSSTGSLALVSSMLQRLVAAEVLHCQPGTPAAVAELALSLARLAATFLPQQQASTTAAALLAPLRSQEAAAWFLQAVASVDATLQQPWDAAQQLHVLPLARAAAAGLQAAAITDRGGARSTSEQQPQQQQQAQLPAAAIDTALALLRLLPAGDEGSALHLLALLLGPQQLAGTLAVAGAELQAAAEARSQVALLAADGCGGGGAGVSGSSGGSDSSNSGPPALPQVEQLSALLLAGYAAPWLGLVPESQQHQQQQQQQQEQRQQNRQVQAGAPAAAAHVEPPASATLLRPQGSRLPLPSDWMLQEAPLPPAEAGIAAGPAEAASGALLLTLGWEQQQLSSLGAVHYSSAAVQQPGTGAIQPPLAGATSALAEHKLRAAVLLLFGDQQQQRAGIVPGAAATAAAGQEDGREVWEDPLARWCLAALMKIYCCSSADASSSTSSGAAIAAAAAAVASASGSTAATDTGLRLWQQQEARQLAQQFASVSYGDTLYGAAVALLLRQPVALDTQLEVLSTLADEQALHLLPPLRLLPGPPATYLHTPTTTASSTTGSSFGSACFGGPSLGSGSSGGGSGRRAELDLYVKLLGEGPLERCLAAAGSEGSSGDSESGSQEGNGAALAACSVAVPLVLHRLVCASFPDAVPRREPPAEQEQTRQQAVLCSILQHCIGGSSSGHQQPSCLLGLLLRWDAAAMQPSDVISAERLASVEAACSTAGLNFADVLHDALEA